MAMKRPLAIHRSERLTRHEVARQPSRDSEITPRATVALTGLWLCLVACGCSSVHSEGELVGQFHAAYSFGTADLRLLSNHKYSQVVHVGDESATADGEWSYKSSQGTMVLLLERCLSATNGFGKLSPTWKVPAEGACSPAARRGTFGIGRVQIVDDDEVPYEKVSE